MQVQKSPVFRRDGADIHSDLFVSVAQAILGGSARTQGLYEILNLSVSLTAVTSFTQIKGKDSNLVQFTNRLMLSPLQIPAGVQSDQKIRLSGKGIARFSGYGFGDHYVHVKVKIPK